MTELKNCPFCGNRKKLDVTDNRHREYLVYCQMCETYGPTEASEEAAIKAWNSRTPDTGEE